KPRLEAAFGPGPAGDIMSSLNGLVSAAGSDPKLNYVTPQIVDVSAFQPVNAAFAAVDESPCSPDDNNNVVKAVNDAVDGLGNLSNIRYMVVVGDDDIFSHARVFDG